MTVLTLDLRKNSLGDDGCRELFRFLCTDDGRQCRIMRIYLNLNGIDNVGLEAIAEYLNGNLYLRTLTLKNVRLFALYSSLQPNSFSLTECF